MTFQMRCHIHVFPFGVSGLDLTPPMAVKMKKMQIQNKTHLFNLWKITLTPFSLENNWKSCPYFYSNYEIDSFLDQKIFVYVICKSLFCLFVVSSYSHETVKYVYQTKSTFKKLGVEVIVSEGK